MSLTDILDACASHIVLDSVLNKFLMTVLDSCAGQVWWIVMLEEFVQQMCLTNGLDDCA